jgi:hypothetical protein
MFLGSRCRNYSQPVILRRTRFWATMLRRSNKVPPMIARWDVLLVAAVIAGASMMIENSHRVDTGLADDAMAAPACTDALAARADALPTCE